MKKRKWIIFISSILILEGIALLGLSAIGGKKSQAENKPHAYNTKRNREQKALKIYEKNKDALILVNARYGLDESYDARLRTICNGRLQASKRIYKSLSKMLEAAGEQGFHYWIASAWRNREKQQQLIDEDTTRLVKKGASRKEALIETYRETMPAGHSEHETGLALDVLCTGNTNMDVSQDKEPGNHWLQKNCHRYGFILRYPKDKEDITGINYEPWHFRYVGREAATYMKKHNLTLEEFWDELGFTPED